MAQLSCDNLSIGYETGIVVKDLSFSIDSGDYLAIVGENGTGKSTLIKTILGLIKPIKGEIKMDESLKRNGIGYLPQQTIVQKDFPASVFEIVLSGFASINGFRPFYTKEEREIAKANIKKMGLSGYEKYPYKELSGGQMQRVLLSRALCSTTRILLLDEPVSGLDPIVTQEMYELINNLNKEGITIIMISHDVKEAVKYANKILHIGNKVFFGTTYEYLNSDFGKVFIDGGK